MGATSDFSAWLKRHWFPVALTLIAFAGYGVGKDMAMTDNDRDAASRTSHQLEG